MDFYERQPAPRVIRRLMFGIIIFEVVFTVGLSWLFEVSSGGETPFEPMAAVFTGLTTLAIGIAMGSMVLKIWIDDQGIRLRMPPFHFSERTISWSDIESVMIRTVSPFGEFGGWGYRWNLGKKTGYVWNGKQGIEVKLKNGKSVVITIMDLEGAQKAIEERATVQLKDIVL